MIISLDPNIEFYISTAHQALNFDHKKGYSIFVDIILKASDTVDHCLLLQQLFCVGLEETCTWFKS